MFKPIFNLTASLTNLLAKIETVKINTQSLPITQSVMLSLRESARFHTIHYSTKIEGNRLTLDEVESLIKLGQTFPNKKRDEIEILGYHAALDYIKNYTSKKIKLSEKIIQELHAVIMSGGKKTIKPLAYRDSQNAIYDGNSGKIVYLPPEAKDVKKLMAEFVLWLNEMELQDFSKPLLAAIAHYQFVTIHPYFDGNGRTARLLATLILYRGNYDLNGIYSLEEYYANDLANYYDQISIGPSHNYYMGRAQADITSWLTYFCEGMLYSFEKIKTHALIAYSKSISSKDWLNYLDSKQRSALSLFKKKSIISSKDVELFFNICARTARALCQKWVADNFLVINDASKKNRSYKLNSRYK